MKITKRFDVNMAEKGQRFLDNVLAQLILQEGKTRCGRYGTFIKKEFNDEKRFTRVYGNKNPEDPDINWVRKRVSKKYIHPSDFVDHVVETLQKTGRIQDIKNLRETFPKRNIEYVFIHDSYVPKETPEGNECERIRRDHADKSYDGLKASKHFRNIASSKNGNSPKFLQDPEEQPEGTLTKSLGAYRRPCVSNTALKMIEDGYNVVIHNPGTID